MRYYEVEAKCGHVGRSNYILKKIYVYARDGKCAALLVRNTPRVKHHHKDAIRSVREISHEEYLHGQELMEKDLYFQVDNSSDQRIMCDIEDDIIKEENESKYKKITHMKQRLIGLVQDREWKTKRALIFE